MNALATAIAFLKRELANGPQLSDDIRAHAAAAGIAYRTLKRARRDLGVVAEKENAVNAPWRLRLPDVSCIQSPVASPPANSHPCPRCHGTGRIPSALTLLDEPDGLGWTLRALMWPEPRIDQLRYELKPDEIVLAARWGGLDVSSSDGSSRTLDRFG
jgi:hypothetical protein